MKNNNKGFFLAETLIVISLVTLILAFVYPNLSKLYETFKLKTNYYDQTQDIQALKSIDFVYNSNINSVCYTLVGGEYKRKESLGFNDASRIISIDIGNMNLEELYITPYEITSPDEAHKSDYGLTRYIKRIRKNKLAPSSCRLIGKFKDNSGEYRYASVEHGIATKVTEGANEKYILKYTDDLTGIRGATLSGIVADEEVISTKNDEKLFMIIGDDRVYRMLSSIRNINGGLYCEAKVDAETNEPIATIESSKINLNDTYLNNCSFYYFMQDNEDYKNSKNYKTHLFSTDSSSVAAIDSQMDLVDDLLAKYEDDTSIKKENINIMLVYGTNYLLNGSNVETLDIIKSKLIDTGVLNGINYKISLIPSINIEQYNSCAKGSLISNHNSYNTYLNSKYSDKKIYNLTFEPQYESCENSKIAGYDYKDTSNIELLELYLKAFEEGE